MDKKQNMLSRAEVEGLTAEERRFAQEKFQMIYAQQMSKLAAEILHQKRVQDNFNSIEEAEEKLLKLQQQHLKEKMALIEEKRAKKIQQKVKQYKQNDERWIHKLKQIQSKFRLQNREALEKARKYRQDSEKYWKSKYKKSQQHSRTAVESSVVRKHQLTQAGPLNKSAIEKAFGNPKFSTVQKKTISREDEKSERGELKKSKSRLDVDIKLHKHKSDSLQWEKQQFIFEKAIKKMEKIQCKRSSIIKKREVKVEPTKPRVIDSSHIYKPRQKKRSKQFSSDNLMEGRSKQSLQKLIKDHLDTKHKLEEIQFIQRGEILENNFQRNRRDRILKMVKSKVHEIKINALKREGSKTVLVT